MFTVTTPYSKWLDNTAVASGGCTADRRRWAGLVGRWVTLPRWRTAPACSSGVRCRPRTRWRGGWGSARSCRRGGGPRAPARTLPRRLHRASRPSSPPWRGTSSWGYLETNTKTLWKTAYNYEIPLLLLILWDKGTWISQPPYWLTVCNPRDLESGLRNGVRDKILLFCGRHLGLDSQASEGVKPVVFFIKNRSVQDGILIWLPEHFSPCYSGEDSSSYPAP